MHNVEKTQSLMGLLRHVTVAQPCLDMYWVWDRGLVKVNSKDTVSSMFARKCRIHSCCGNIQEEMQLKNTLHCIMWFCCYKWKLCNHHKGVSMFIPVKLSQIYTSLFTCEPLGFCVEATKMNMWLLCVPVCTGHLILVHKPPKGVWMSAVALLICTERKYPQYMYLSIFMFNHLGVVELWFFKLLNC